MGHTSVAMSARRHLKVLLEGLLEYHEIRIKGVSVASEAVSIWGFEPAFPEMTKHSNTISTSASRRVVCGRLARAKVALSFPMLFRGVLA